MNASFSSARSLSLVAGVAIVFALATFSSAQAAIVYSGVQNVSVVYTAGSVTYVDINPPFTSSPTYFGPAVDVDFGYNGGVAAVLAKQTGSTFVGLSLSTDPAMLAKLPAGTLISGASTDFTDYGLTFFDGNQPGHPDPWADGDDAYFGFRFDLPTDLYGWGRIQFVGDTDAVDGSHTVTLVEWAYDDTGAAILTGDTGLAAETVPEPTTFVLAALGLGALGLLAWRRRK